MIGHEEIAQVVQKYDSNNVCVTILGSHSAKEMGIAAKRAGYGTILFVEEGRELLYEGHNKHLFDYVIKRPKFSQMADEDVQNKIREKNGIVFPHRSFYVYVQPNPKDERPIEDDFLVPIYGNRRLLRAEDRNQDVSQYTLMEDAGMRFPRKFEPDKINMPVIVKIQQKGKKLERASFYARDHEDFKRKAQDRIKSGEISETDLAEARIEEYVIGPRFNANFQRYGLNINDPKVFPNDYDLVGFGDRIQVDIAGWRNLDAQSQLDLLSDWPPRNAEAGSFGVTMRESLQPLAYEQGGKFIDASTKKFPPGIIGPFGVQGGLQYVKKIEDGRLVRTNKLEFVVFDLSLRNSGDPHIAATSPEMENLTIKHWEILMKLRHVPWNEPRRIAGPLDLAMMELEMATKLKRLQDIVT